LLAGFAEHARIDYLNAHGTATQANDAVEAEAVLEVFGPADRQPLINSTKGILGHTLGASGAIETAVTALSLHRANVHPNATRDPLPDLRLPLEITEARLEHALTVSYGFGGHNAGLLLKRYG
jgi:3-oxoacyl-[acyl-carrier-protein] synthase II